MFRPSQHPDPWLQPSNDADLPWSQPAAVDRQFIHLLEMFRPSGGLASLTEVRHWLAAGDAATRKPLEDWICTRRVVCFEWQQRTWLPWFQFNRHTLAPHVQLHPVLVELNAVHQPWEVACWFAQANPWLHDQAPVDCLLSNLSGVLHAARADSVIANGSTRMRH